jgi:hypothetical protein
MFDEFPSANCYKDGTNTRHSLGSYQVRPVNKNGTKYVVNVFAQSHHTGRRETRQEQARLYGEALRKFAQEITGPCTIGIPDKGAGFTRAAQNFANQVRHKGAKVYLYNYGGRWNVDPRGRQI